MQQSLSAMGRAESRLRELARRASRSDDSRLPTIRAIADQAGLSISTVWKAGARLKEQGVLVSRRGSRVMVPSAARPDEPAGPRPRWQQVQDALVRDISNSVYHPGSPLPPAKELTARYGACYATVKSALDSLLGSGTIERHFRGYRVPSLTTGPRGGTIVYIARGQPDGSIMTVGPRSEELIQSLETESAMAGVTLRTLSYDYPNGRIHRTRDSLSLLAPSSRPGAVLGYLVREQGIHNPRQQDARNLVSLMTRLGRTGKPVALLDEGSEVTAWPVARGLATRAVTINLRCDRFLRETLLSRSSHRAYALSAITQYVGS